MQRYLSEPAGIPELGKLIEAPFKTAKVEKLDVISVGAVVQVCSLPSLAEVIFN